MPAESILTSVKKLLGLDESYEEFDVDIIMHINSTFATLNQLAVGPDNSLFITDKSTTWQAFIGDQANINSVKSYVWAKVKLLFDPPPTSFAITSLENMAKEYEWRLNVVMEMVRHPVLMDPTDPDYPPANVILSGEQQPNTWDLTGGLDFPAKAKIGDIGIDYDSGDVWRNVL